MVAFCSVPRNRTVFVPHHFKGYGALTRCSQVFPTNTTNTAPISNAGRTRNVCATCVCVGCQTQAEQFRNAHGAVPVPVPGTCSCSRNKGTGSHERFPRVPCEGGLRVAFPPPGPRMVPHVNETFGFFKAGSSDGSDSCSSPVS